MDCSAQQKRKFNPIENASILSKLTFLFTLPLFRKGEIKESDVYKTIKSYSTTKLGNELGSEWEKEKHKKDPWLLRPLLRLFGKQIILWGVMFLLIDSIATTAKPLLVRKIVKFFDPKQTSITLTDGVVYCGVLVITLIISGVMRLFCGFQTEQLTQKMKIACSALVYRKLLRSTVSENSRGQAINLITKDINSADMLLFAIYYLIVGIFQLVILSYIMYTQIGISTFIGLSWLLIYFPLQALFGKYGAHLRLRAANITDKRLRETQEVFTAIRVIKMYTWESFHAKAVESIRQKEMAYVRYFRCAEAVAFFLGSFSLKLIFCISIVSYVSFGQHLTAEKVFTVTTCVSMLFGIVQMAAPLSASQLGNLLATMRRFTNFLLYEEVIAKLNKNDSFEVCPEITVKNLTVKLGNAIVIDNISFRIEKGLAIVKGPTGTGKSILLLSLMDEVQRTHGLIDVKGSISYASQEPWLFPGTIRQNIVFGEPYHSKRYNTVIELCSLTKDFESFFDGDATYITDRGLNLSRGQKTRINLARCVYKTADIYLLDDCLSSLDTRVANCVFYRCVKDFLKNKICIMATYSDRFMQDTNHVLELQKGKLKYFVTKSEINTETEKLVLPKGYDRETEPKQICNEMQDSSLETSKLLDSKNTIENIYKETNMQGSVTKQVYYFYLSSVRGIWVFIFMFIVFVASQGMSSYAEYFVSIWAKAEQKLSDTRIMNITNSIEYKEMEDSCKNMLIRYCIIVTSSLSIGLASYIAYLFFSTAASVNIHRKILSKIVGAAMQFFDTNLSGNVLNRFSRDLGIIDEQLPMTLLHFIKMGLVVTATLGMISVVRPFLVLPSVLLLIILYVERRLYLPTSRSILRLQGAVRSPIIGHFNATVDGLTTIRANKMQAVLLKEYDHHQDLYNSVILMNISSSSAFAFLLDMTCSLYIGAVLLALLFLKNSIASGDAGLAITQALTLSGMLLQYTTRLWADVENLMTSVERAMVYTTPKLENKTGREPPNWPMQGTVVYKNVNLRYPLTGDLVLKDIDFTLNSKEKLGVVGRTGAGKSSLISVLFRLYEFDGCVTIDGMDTNQISLDYLRSKISIIPQDPFLFAGTVRENLDPQNKYSDMQLWDALDEVEMKPHIISLKSLISEGGNNFSIGQRQLMCLARAILRKNVILVLDEATANLDHNTDITIQKTIKNNFSGCTVITIAHRIATIMNSDKILVVDQGQVIEFGSPQFLLGNKNGSFYKMVNEAGLINQ